MFILKPRYFFFISAVVDSRKWMTKKKMCRVEDEGCGRCNKVGGSQLSFVYNEGGSGFLWFPDRQSITRISRASRVSATIYHHSSLSRAFGISDLNMRLCCCRGYY